MFFGAGVCGFWPVFWGAGWSFRVLAGPSWALVGRVVTDSIFSAVFMESATR
ncbi:hypothetical protein CFREI_02640 [Corynebacterium freiburgense]|nr:hypothetical protein CFREI_02640 [Corynebacterium freiburgense]